MKEVHKVFLILAIGILGIFLLFPYFFRWLDDVAPLPIPTCPDGMVLIDGGRGRVNGNRHVVCVEGVEAIWKVPGREP